MTTNRTWVQREIKSWRRTDIQCPQDKRGRQQYRRISVRIMIVAKLNRSKNGQKRRKEEESRKSQWETERDTEIREQRQCGGAVAGELIGLDWDRYWAQWNVSIVSNVSYFNPFLPNCCRIFSSAPTCRF